jgi:DNA-binding transcriptional LysR family regulator
MMPIPCGAVDTVLLRTFLAVARHHSFTAAAADLHVVQSTVTTRVKMLERELGLRLLDRLPDGAVLTSAGERLVNHARQVIAAEESLREAATSDGTPAGDVVLGAPETVCAYRLPGVIAALTKTYPGVNVHLAPTGTAQTFQGLSDRTLDLGLILDSRGVPAQLTSAVIGAEAITLVAGPDHPAIRRRLTMRNLLNYPFYLLEEGCSYTDDFVADMVKATGASPRITRFGSVEAARACVQAGLGLSILPVTTVTTECANQRLICLSTPRRPQAPLRLVTLRHRSLSPAAGALANATTDAAKAWPNTRRPQ